jgi:7-alpha-hydroxysteroid dehydrogenase
MGSLDNQIAVVTGAGRGIGRAIALKFAAEGADVVCVSRTAENSEKVAAEVRTAGRKAWAVALDVADAKPLKPPPKKFSPTVAASTSW